MSLLGAFLGVLVALCVEAWTIRARLRAQSDERPPLPALAGGLLVRLTLLFVGTLLGAFLELWSPIAYLLASASVLLLGEALAFALLHRSSSSTTRSPK